MLQVKILITFLYNLHISQWNFVIFAKIYMEQDSFRENKPCWVNSKTTVKWGQTDMISTIKMNIIPVKSSSYYGLRNDSVD